MKKALLVVFLLVMGTIIAQSPTIRLLENPSMPTFTGDYKRSLEVYCDAPRGNIVYIVGDIGTPSIAITAIHQPDICK